jgi:hypothetical protein
VDVNEIYTLRFVEGCLKENTPAFKATWRYHQSWDLRAGGFHSQWGSWIKANPEATRDQILATMEELRAAFLVTPTPQRRREPPSACPAPF